MKIIRNKPSHGELYKLYIDDGLSSIDIAKIYDCDPTTVCNWLKRYDIRIRNYSEATIKIYENPVARKKASEAQDEYWNDPSVRDRQRERAIKQWEDPLHHENARERTSKWWDDPLHHRIMVDASNKRWENPLEHEKTRKALNRYWEDPITRERLSAVKQGQDYDAGEWTGFTDKDRKHLIPKSQCIHLNPWFEGCNQHHIMTGVIINLPGDLHKGVWHRMPHDNQKEKNMKEINKLAFEYLLGES